MHAGMTQAILYLNNVPRTVSFLRDSIRSGTALKVFNSIFLDAASVDDVHLATYWSKTCVCLDCNLSKYSNNLTP